MPALPLYPILSDLFRLSLIGTLLCGIAGVGLPSSSAEPNPSAGCAAQFDAARGSLLDYHGKQLRLDHDKRLAHTQKLLSLAKGFAERQNIQTLEIELQNKSGQTYPALLIQDRGNHPLNQEAARVSKRYSGLPLVLSPYDLSYGSVAFLDSNGSKLGVSYRTFTDGPTSDSSLQHEYIHVEDFLALQNGITPLWSGYAKTYEPLHILSVNNQHSYQRFVALHELVATLYSAGADTQAIQSAISKTGFDLWQIEVQLTEVHYTLESAHAQAKQLASLTERALLLPAPSQASWVTQQLGNQKISVYRTTFLLESYERQIINSAGTFVPHPNGAEFSLNWAQVASPQAVRERLQKIHEMARYAQKETQVILKSINMGIERAELKGTDLDSVRTQAQRLKAVLDDLD